MVERWVWSILFALRRWTGSRRPLDHHLRTERELIGELVRFCDAEMGSHRFLIKRPYGLEDSSRYWSVWMTLDHLRIVHGEFIRIIGALANGMIPEGEARTAAVKPSPAATAAVAVAYEESCEALLAVVTAAPNLKSTLRFAHPWLGPLDAAGWYALAGVYMRIHRVQITRILEEFRPR